MTITYKKKEGRFGVLSIYADDDWWHDIHTHIFGKQPSIHAVCQNTEDLKKNFSNLEYRAAKAYTLKRLTLKSQPSTELRKALEERLVSEENIDKIITEFQRLGYLNDHDWVESFIKSRMARNLGPQAITMKLRAKGVPPEVYQEILSKLDNSSLQKERIQHLIETRYQNRDLSDYKIRQKVVASLIRKGFSFNEIRSCFSDMEF